METGIIRKVLQCSSRIFNGVCNQPLLEFGENENASDRLRIGKQNTRSFKVFDRFLVLVKTKANERQIEVSKTIFGIDSEHLLEKVSRPSQS